MPEGFNNEGAKFVPPREIAGSERSIEDEIKLSGQGGLHADAESIASLLGHNDPKRVEEYLNDEDH